MSTEVYYNLINNALHTNMFCLVRCSSEESYDVHSCLSAFFFFTFP